ncbi:MAG: ribosome small subunit-dependent GTPase A [Mycobacteriales bacterium]
MSAHLDDLGWDDAWAAQLSALAASRPDLTEQVQRPARVARTDRGRCVVHTAEDICHAELGPSLDPAPTTGDWVLLDDARTVRAVLPRRTCVMRGAGRGDTRGQVLAANVDVLFVVAALSEGPNLSRLERLLALAWESGARPVVLLTKSDLSSTVESERAEVSQIAPGIDVIAASARTGEGLEDLRSTLAHGTTGALIGPSGSGKSSLVNALLGTDLLPTSDLRDDGKGRHTSTARELVALPWGAVLLDTPGLRGVQLWDAADGIERTFSDVESLAEQCRFTDCAHRGEPGCAIAAAVADGSLAQRRLASWEKLRREQSWLASRYDARLRAEQRRRWKDLSKQSRQRGR